MNTLLKFDDSETDKRIKEIAKNQPKFKEGAPDTKAKEGDLVALDYKATIDGKEFKGSEGKNTQLTSVSYTHLTLPTTPYV